MIEKTQIDPSGLSTEEFEKQKKELLRRKKNAQELIDDVLANARNYSDIVLQMVNFTNSPSRFRMEDWEYKEKFTDFDQRRRACHNTLIDSISIAIRYIRLNFGKLSDEELEEFETDSRRRKKLVLAIERVILPNKVIFPESMNLDDRNQIADWAEKVVQEEKKRDLE